MAGGCPQPVVGAAMAGRWGRHGSAGGTMTTKLTSGRVRTFLGCDKAGAVTPRPWGAGRKGCVRRGLRVELSLCPQPGS